MTQVTEFGEAEVDAYIRVDRKDGRVEFYHIVDEQNIPITAEEYAAAHQEG